MDKIENIIAKLIKYIDKIEQNNIKIQKAYLFGSQIHNSAKEYSDIDIALVSADFSGNKYYDREKIRKLRWDIDVLISPITFIPEEFDASNLFVKEIIETGIRIK